MLKHQWQLFGLPNIITTDLGSHFAGAWFTTLAAGLGIRQSFSQAYNHQANGRAERAGQQLMERLRKINADSVVNWVTALPTALRQIHDSPGESGLSPYQILFGRDRNIPNLPYAPPRTCEDASDFLHRMERVDQHVAKTLNYMHEKEAERLNKSRTSPPVFAIDSKVWYRRPEDSGDKLDTRWLGPAVVLRQTGADSYEVRLNDRKTINSPARFLKPYYEDTFSGNPKPLYHHQRTVPDPDAGPDEWNVERVVDHRLRDGQREYLIHWEGFSERDRTWERGKNFVLRYSKPVIDYCKEHRLTFDLTKIV